MLQGTGSWSAVFLLSALHYILGSAVWYRPLAYKVMAHIVMAYIGMVRIGVAYIVMALLPDADPTRPPTCRSPNCIGIVDNHVFNPQALLMAASARAF